MSAQWSPADDELDLVARSVAPPAPTSARAEQMRTRLLAAQPLMSQQRPRRAWPLVAGISAALAAAAAILLWLPARPSHPVSRSMIVATVPTQYAELSAWPDQLLQLDDGRLDIALDPLSPGERFRVRSGGDEVEVRGTQFVVVASHRQITSVVVERGLVELRRPNEPAVMLGAGERWDRVQTASAAPGPVSTSPASPTKPTAPAGSAATASNSVATTQPTGATKAVPTTTAPPRSAPAGAATKPAGTTSSSVGVATAKPAGASTIPATAAAAKPAGAPGQPAITTSVAPAPPPAASAKPGEAEFRTGWAALRAGKAEEAARSFSTSCGAAQNEAFGEDACFWTGVAAKRAGQTKLAREALTRFLAKFPSSGRAAEASALLGWELYDAGDLDGAERLFERAVTDRVPKVRDSATRGLTAIGRRRKAP